MRHFPARRLSLASAIALVALAVSMPTFVLDADARPSATAAKRHKKHHHKKHHKKHHKSSSVTCQGDVGAPLPSGATYSNLQATGVGCPVARGVAQQSDSARGANYSAQGFSCVGTAVNGVTTYTHYQCSSGSQKIAFDYNP